MKRTILSIVVLMAAISAMAQTWKVVKTDGSVVRFPASSVNYVTVEAEDYEYVDLGLPSGTLWATRNIGADNPEDFGDYFAWGETATKSYYDWSSYKWCNGSETTITKYCSMSSNGYNGFTDNLTELLPEDDAAYVNWGSDWRMPTITQFEELLKNSYTTTEWTTKNGVYGRKITSKTNGNSIFLPAAGARNDGSLGDAGSRGHYWSRTLNTSSPDKARRLYFNSSGIYTSYYSTRFSGISVRPVRAQ
ncbi:MAG: hypothetical protein J6Y39_06240 [Bacteroidaceae bacterium]|nr:hypothetical protein [Bacteroidaceae bacterium]